MAYIRWYTNALFLPSVCCAGGIDVADWCPPARCRRRSESWTPSTSRFRTAGGSGPGYPVNFAGRSSSTSGAGRRARCTDSGRTWASGSGRGGCSRATVPRARRRARYPRACTAEPLGASTRRCCDGTAGALTSHRPHYSTTVCRAQRRRGRWSTR